MFTGGVISMSGSGEKFRLVTQSDFDGLVCAVLLKELDLIDDIKFVHPKDMQDGTILISENDIISYYDSSDYDSSDTESIWTVSEPDNELDPGICTRSLLKL